MVDDAFLDMVNSNLTLRVPRTLSVIGRDLAEVFDEISIPCPLQTLHIKGSMSCLRNAIPFILNNLDLFADLDTIFYTATPPFGLDMPMTYCWIVADGDSLDPPPVVIRFIDVHLRVPSMHPINGQFSLQTAVVRLNTAVPVESEITVHPPTDTLS